MECQKTVTVTLCDFCKREEAWRKCLGCGKDICTDCVKLEAVEYRVAVFYDSSRNGIYCHSCDTKLFGRDELHRAYDLMRRIAAEHDAFYGPWKKRADAAEKALEKLIEERRKAQEQGGKPCP